MATYRWVDRVLSWTGTHPAWLAANWSLILAAMGTRERAELAAAYFLAEQIWINNPDQDFSIFNNNPALDPCASRGNCQRGFYQASYGSFSEALRAFKLRLRRSRQAYRLFVAGNVDWFRAAMVARRLPVDSANEAVTRYRQVWGIVGDWSQQQLEHSGVVGV